MELFHAARGQSEPSASLLCLFVFFFFLRDISIGEPPYSQFCVKTERGSERTLLAHRAIPLDGQPFVE